MRLKPIAFSVTLACASVLTAPGTVAATTFSASFTKQGPASGGIIYYSGRIPQAPGELQTITNKKINALGKAWTVLIPKAGYSTNDCHRSDRMIVLPPGGSTNAYAGTSLYRGGFLFGFCLTSTDQWTLAAGWPNAWTLGITYTRPGDGEPTGSGAKANLPLELWWSARRGDNFTATSDRGKRDARNAGYQRVRVEACIFKEKVPGTVALKLYWSGGRGDNFSIADSKGAQDANWAGYRFVRTQGYVYRDRKPGTVPLKLYYSPKRGDNFVTVTETGERDAKGAGYRYARIAGYVHPAKECSR
jgi:hypothetical protein